MPFIIDSQDSFSSIKIPVVSKEAGIDNTIIMSDKEIGSSPISDQRDDDTNRMRGNVVKRIIERTRHDRPLPSKRRLYGMM